MVSKLAFVFGSTVFFLFLVNITAMMGSSVLDGFEIDTTLVDYTGFGPLDILFGFINNISIFYQLTTVSSSFGLFGGVLVLGYTITIIYLLAELFRGV